MQTQLTIVGVKQFKGNIEGTDYDQTKVICLMPFPKARSTSNQGFDAIEMQYGNSEVFKKFDGRKYPLVVDADIEAVTSGGRMTFEVHEIKFPPVTQQKPA